MDFHSPSVIILNKLIKQQDLATRWLLLNKIAVQANIFLEPVVWQPVTIGQYKLQMQLVFVVPL